MSNVSKKQSFLFKIILTSMLIALNIILERMLAINKWDMSISFSFVTIGFAAVYLGMPYAVAVAGFGDLIGALLIPFGPYFVGFTISNMIAGLSLGFFMQKRANIFKISAAVFINKTVCTMLINNLCIVYVYSKGLKALPAMMISRFPFAAITFLVEVVVLTLLFDDNSQVKKTLKRALSRFI